MKRISGIFWIFVLAGGLSMPAGCAVVESESVKTDGMWAHFVAEHHPNDRAVVLASLWVGERGGTVIDLTGEDKMLCNGVKMTEYEEEFTNIHWTGAELSPDPNNEYVFSFVRADEQVDTVVVTPDIPTISDPSPMDVFTAGEQITVTWDASQPGDYVNFFQYGNCIKDKWIFEKPDTGSYTLPALEDQDPNNPEACTIGLQIRRIVEGNVAQDFKDGETEGKGIDIVELAYQ
jgi:hypothetical protein